MVVAAHPDDAEFGCGGTVCRWIDEGAEAFLLVATNGNKGDDEGTVEPDKLAALRQEEQRKAAKVVGFKDVKFLPFEDGSLIYGIALRGEVVRSIRTWKPDALFTHDPSPFIHTDGTVNHADHRAIGAAAVDAVYPFSRGRHQYPEQIKDGLSPHKVSELYLWGSHHPDFFEDIQATIHRKIEALCCHRSQFKDTEKIADLVVGNARKAGHRVGVSLAEEFKKVVFE